MHSMLWACCCAAVGSAWLDSTASCASCLLLPAAVQGQWAYGTPALKAAWAARPGSAALLASSASHKAALAAAVTPAPVAEGAAAPGLDTGAGAGAAAPAAAGAEPASALAEAPEDPATGKPPLLLSANELADAFWAGSKHGAAMLREVRAGRA